MCPKDIDRQRAQELLDGSLPEGGKRYATDGERAYCAQEHREGLWHGYPIGWKEVPFKVRRALETDGKITRKLMKKHWEGT